MKNTGRRIFRGIFALMLVSLPLIASAGLFVSQR